jgi:hypothetical protein
MPSLAQLKQFQNLMGTVGREDEFRAKNGLPSDDYTLPDREPAPLPQPKPKPPPVPPPSPAQEPPPKLKPSPAPKPPPEPETPEPEMPDIPPPDFPPAAAEPPPDFPPAAAVPVPPDIPSPGADILSGGGDAPEAEVPDFDFNFEDFVKSRPDDSEVPPPDEEIPSGAPPPGSPEFESSGENEALDSGDDFDLDLSNFGIDDEAGSAAPPDESSPAMSFDDNLTALPDDDKPAAPPDGAVPDSPFDDDEPAAPSGEAVPDSPPDEAGSGVPAGEGTAGFDDDFLASLGENAAGEAEPPADFDISGMISDDTAGLENDISEIKNKPFTTADDEFLNSLNLGASDEELSSLFPDRADELSSDAADTTQAETPGGESAGEMPAAGSSAGDSFDAFDLGGAQSAASENLPDIEDLNLNLPKEGEPDIPAIEEINLTEEELATLLGTIAAYPLNVRITCEETIAEQVIPPAQLSELVKLLVAGGTAHEAAKLLSKIHKKTITVPKGYKTGEELEEEQSSFAYIFIHKFLPFARIALIVATLAASVAYLSWQFIYKPIAADNLYKRGYELILSGEPNNYNIANQCFNDAFGIHRVKDWFYKYAERFRDQRQYLHAEDKYDALLRFYPHDKKGALDYAAMEAYYLRNYEKADRIIRREILDYSIDDRDGLLALGDINLEWGEIDKDRYEEARAAYARHLAIYGYSDPVLERMMLYFIRTDKLVEVLPLQQYFMGRPKSKISAPSLAELGGYLLDKRFEVPNGVPDENIERIEGIKDILLRAAKLDGTLPEPHYHLARYYEFYGDPGNERVTLEAASRAFDNAKLETPKRVRYRIDTQRKLASLMMESREFIPAENALVKGVNIYEDAVSRRVLTRAGEFGRLYADLGDIEYFAKTGDMARAERYYLDAESNGWLPPEIEYRLGSAYYRQGYSHAALTRFFNVSEEIPFNRKLLNTLGAASFANADYFASEAYYQRLLTMLRRDRDRLPVVLPDNIPEHRVLLERMMIAENNMGVTMNALAGRTGKSSYRAQALGLFSESARIWDALERDQKTMVRPGLTDPALPGASLPYLNIRQTLYPVSGEQTQMFTRIDADVLDPSVWEERMSLSR